LFSHPVTLHSRPFAAHQDVLHEKYKMTAEEAAVLTSFLRPMLELNPQRRSTAGDSLKHPWLRDVDVTLPIVLEEPKSVRRT